MAVYIGSLKPGSLFKLGAELYGVVLIQRHGYTQVKVTKGETIHVDIGEGFDAVPGKTTEWSPNTRVEPINKEEEMGVLNETVASLKKAAENKKKAAVKAGKKTKATIKREAEVVKKTTQINKCKCGCGGQTKGTFCPGHDARYYGWLRKFVNGQLKWDELPIHVRKEFKTTTALKAFWTKKGH